MTKLKIKKDDMVLVLAGNSKDKKDQNEIGRAHV